VFALPSELQHLSVLEVFETSTRHPCIFNELIFFYKDKIIILNYIKSFFVFFVEVEGLEPSCRIFQLLRTTRLGQYFLILRNLLSCSSPSLDNHQWTIRFKIQWYFTFLGVSVPRCFTHLPDVVDASTLPLLHQL